MLNNNISFQKDESNGITKAFKEAVIALEAAQCAFDNAPNIHSLIDEAIYNYNAALARFRYIQGVIRDGQQNCKYKVM